MWLPRYRNVRRIMFPRRQYLNHYFHFSLRFLHHLFNPCRMNTSIHNQFFKRNPSHFTTNWIKTGQNNRFRRIAKLREEVTKLNEQRLQELERISGLTSEQAKDYLLKIVEDEVKHESAVMIKEMESRAKEEADKKAKEYVVMTPALITLRFCPPLFNLLVQFVLGTDGLFLDFKQGLSLLCLSSFQRFIDNLSCLILRIVPRYRNVRRIMFPRRQYLWYSFRMTK